MRQKLFLCLTTLLLATLPNLAEANRQLKEAATPPTEPAPEKEPVEKKEVAAPAPAPQPKKAAAPEKEEAESDTPVHMTAEQYRQKQKDDYMKQLKERQEAKDAFAAQFKSRRDAVKNKKFAESELLDMSAFEPGLLDSSPPDGLYEVDLGIQEGNFGQLLAFADMNSDKYSDLISVDSSLNTIQIHTWDPSDKSFNNWKSINVDGCSNIYNAVVGRSTNNLRIYVTCQQGESTYVKIIDRRNIGGEDSTEYGFMSAPGLTLTIESDSQPFITDLNGDYLEDILYTDPSSNQIMVAFQTKDPAKPWVVTDFHSSMRVKDSGEGCIQSDPTQKRLTIPHSAAMIDFDGDCMADLFLTVQDVSSGRKYYEIYLRREKNEKMSTGGDAKKSPPKNATVSDDDSAGPNFRELDGLGSFCLIAREEVPENINNMFYFADFDRDGMIDMMYMNSVADSNGLQTTIIYNALLNYEREFQTRSKISEVSDALLQLTTVCSPSDRPVSEVSEIFFPPSKIGSVLDDKGIPQTDKVTRQTIFNSDSEWTSINNVDSKHSPGRIAIGDISSDGYPDLLTVFASDTKTTPYILLNNPCQLSTCSADAMDSKRRTFSLTANSLNKFISDDQDLDESLVSTVFEGKLTDLNVTETDSDVDQEVTDYKVSLSEFSSILGAYDKVLYGTFFNLGNDASQDILLVTKSGEEGTKLRSIYNNIEMNNFYLRMKMVSDEYSHAHVLSASYRCVITLANDRKIIVQGGNTGQSAFHAINPAITSIGIGMSNNFVEQFSVGYFSGGQRVLRTWTPVIPRSTLFVITDMQKDETLWTLTLMLSPTEKLPLILVIDGLFLLCLGLFIIVLHMYEKAEDEKERQTVSAFNYF